MSNRTQSHLLRILDSSGHTEVEYDPADQKAVDDVKSRFESLMARNFIAFDVTEQPGKVINTFDPSAREIIISHRFAGG